MGPSIWVSLGQSVIMWFIRAMMTLSCRPYHSHFRGFEYYATWNETFPTLLLAGIGHLQIHLPEGQHKVKDWTIQLRYPHEMIDVESYQEKIVEMDCGGQGCPSQHYPVVPHFWDETKLNLGFELASKWDYDYIEIYPEIGDGPVPCVDWCENGEIPEYRGNCHLI